MGQEERSLSRANERDVRGLPHPVWAQTTGQEGRGQGCRVSCCCVLSIAPPPPLWVGRTLAPFGY